MNKNKILIADTNESFLKVAEEKLTTRGYIVKASSNPKRAITLLEEYEFDAIFMNFNSDDSMKTLLFVESLKNKPRILYSNDTINTAEQFFSL